MLLQKKTSRFIGVIFYTLLPLLFLTIYSSEESTDLHAVFGASFDDSMYHSCNYQESLPEQYYNWNLAKTLFNQHIFNAPEVKKSTSIPKIIHQIWLGSELPKKSKVLQKSWIENHPTWIYILWTDNGSNYDKNDLVLHSFEEVIAWLNRRPEDKTICIVDIRKLNLENRYAYNHSPNYGEKSDITRYEILYKIGGLYIDTDFECLKPFDPIHNHCDFFAGVSYEREYIVYNGLIGCHAGHPIIRNCIDQIKQNYSKHSSTMARTGPYLLTKCIEEHVAKYQDKTVIFPVTYFYPWSNYDLSKPEINAKNSIKEESFAVHHWHRSWFC